jgi:hypothetical protein
LREKHPAGGLFSVACALESSSSSSSFSSSIDDRGSRQWAAIEGQQAAKQSLDTSLMPASTQPTTKDEDDTVKRD